MLKFIKNSIIFILLGLVVGEAVTRVFKLTSEVPKRIVDIHGVQKYVPNQQGHWKGGKHMWQINEYGWAGIAPKSFDNLVTIIGDSFISNFMNPDVCHQGLILKQLLPENNFFEVARPGVSFIEAMDFTKRLDSLHPKIQLVYINESDFSESIIQLNRFSYMGQFDVETQKVIPGEMRSPKLKKILYNWKFMFYLYNRFPISLPKLPNFSIEKDIVPVKIPVGPYEYYKSMLDYTVANYAINNVVLIFKPETDVKLVRLCATYGFKTVHLDDSMDADWKFDYDFHWTCYGHNQVAKQVAQWVSDYLNN